VESVERSKVRDRLDFLLGLSYNINSSLVRVIVLKAPIGTGSDFFMISEGDLQNLSILCFTELAELRHRGAFSAVAQAHAGCCSRIHALKALDPLQKLYDVSIFNPLNDRFPALM
jgi:hypothetical protein